MPGQEWPCHGHTPRHPRNNSILFCSSLEFWVTTVVRWRWKENKNTKQWFPIHFFFLIFGQKKKITPLCHFRDVLNRMQTSFVIFWSYRKSEFRDFSWAVSILCCQVEQLKEGSKNVGQWELLGPHADAACENPRKDLLLLGIQSNLLELFIKSPCRQDVNMPLKSSNTIMKTDICNCICVAPLTQT